MESGILYEKMTPGKENYLKVLLELSGEGEIRSIDVADTLGVTKASVSRMCSRLKDEGYVRKEKYGAITLTEKGVEAALNVATRYHLLKVFFTRILGVDNQTAMQDACRIEHIISRESIDKMSKQLSDLSV